MSAALPSPPGKVLVMELAGLGDNVHLLPALWLVRQRWPEAQLHVMVSAHVADLFKLTPWVDRVWAYPRQPKPGLRENLRWACALRRERFDVLINTNGSDRSSLLSWASRAPRRIGRLPKDGGPIGWRHLFTEVMKSPYHAEPMFRQKIACLRQMGFEGEVGFHVQINAGLRRAAGIAAQDDGQYIHISPCTTSDARELPSVQLADLVQRLRAGCPALRIVLSCANNAREQAKLDSVLALLAEPPWKVWRGDLDIAALAAVIAGSRLNLSGDTGSLHLAVMCGTPAVAWFRTHAGELEWIPEDRQHYRVLIAADTPQRDALYGIDNGALMAAIREVLETGASGKP